MQIAFLTIEVPNSPCPFYRLGVVIASFLKWFPDILNSFRAEFEVEIKYTLSIEDIRHGLNQKYPTQLADLVADSLQEIADATKSSD